MKRAWIVVAWIIAVKETQAIAQLPDSHPWLADAPGELVRLIDRGNVQILVDDDRIRNADKTALTTFQFVVDYDFKFRHQLLGYDNESHVWRVKILAWIDQPKVKLDHKIFIQTSFVPELPWQSRLLRHEFDHVAISTDPRLLKLIKRVLQQRRQWVATWSQESAPTEQDVRKNISDTFTVDVRSLEQLVQTLYDYLDKESYQGLSSLNNRKDFFVGLYSVEGLDRCKFELNETLRAYVKEKLSTPSMQRDVASHYVFSTP